MKDWEKQDGRRHLGIRRAAVLGAWLAVVAGAQPATTLDADMQRAYVQAGHVSGPHNLVGPANQLQVRDGLAAHVAIDSVYLEPLRVGCTMPVCGWTCQAQPGRRVAFELSPGTGTALPRFGLLGAERAGDGGFTATVAVAMPGSKVERIEVQVGPMGQIISRTSSTIALAGQPDIRAFAALPASPGDLAPPFLALGMKGALRRIEVSAAGLREVELVSGTGDDFLCHGEGWVGTAQGRIWALRSGFIAPHLELNPAPAAGEAITHIDAYIARVGTDRYRVNRGTHWTEPQPAVTGLRGVIPRWRDNTTWLDLWKVNSLDTRRLEPEEGSLRYRREGGAWMSPSVQPHPYQGGGTWTFEISLRDADRNLEAPFMAIGRSDIGISLFQEGVQADPAYGCLRTGSCLTGEESVIRVTVDADSVRLSMPVLSGIRRIDPNCGLPEFAGERKIWTHAGKWSLGNWISIGTGRFSFFLPYGIVDAVMPRVAKVPPESAPFAGGTRLSFTDGAGRWVDAGGRRIRARAGSSEPRQVPR